MRIGWIGTGIMGSNMCGHLLKKFGPISVFSKPDTRLQTLLDQGCPLKSPIDMAKSCNVIVTMLGYPRDLEDIMLNPATGLLHHSPKDTLFIDHTTSSPSLAQKLHKIGHEKGLLVLDAPVSGGEVGAKAGNLVIMCGGEKAAFEKAEPILKCYSQKAKFFGSAGLGQHVKLANQISLASGVIALSETLLYAESVGLDTRQLLELLKNGAAASWALDKFGPLILDENYEAGFFVEHFIKDIEIALEECRVRNLTLPGLTTAHMLYKMYAAHGGAKKGAQGLIEVLREINNRKIKKD